MRMVFAAAILSLFINPCFAADDDMPEFASVGTWSIRVDTSLDYGCFLVSTFEGGTALRFGFDMTELTLYVAIGDPKWKSIEYGKNYAMEVQFGDESPWSGDAVGFSFSPPENQPWLWITVSDDEELFGEFFGEFMAERSVDFLFKGESIANLSLKDSYKAGLKLFECQQAMASMSDDPFKATRHRPSDDPFQY